MKIIPATYVADDGTTFDNADACVEYEYQKAIDSAKFVMLDESFELTSDMENCFYLEVHSQEELDLFNALLDKYGSIGKIYADYEEASNMGCMRFYWDSYNDCFENMYPLMERFANALTAFEREG